jgi:hypothetical protein
LILMRRSACGVTNAYYTIEGKRTDCCLSA